MSSYSACPDASGRVRDDVVLRDDGVLVLTGHDPFGDDPTALLPDFANENGLAYQAWVKAGGTLGALSLPSPVRSVRGPVLVHALDKATAICPRDLAYVAGLDVVREDMASIARIAKVDGSTPKAWFDAALGVQA